MFLVDPNSFSVALSPFMIIVFARWKSSSPRPSKGPSTPALICLSIGPSRKTSKSSATRCVQTSQPRTLFDEKFWYVNFRPSSIKSGTSSNSPVTESVLNPTTKPPQYCIQLFGAARQLPLFGLPRCQPMLANLIRNGTVRAFANIVRIQPDREIAPFILASPVSILGCACFGLPLSSPTKTRTSADPAD